MNKFTLSMVVLMAISTSVMAETMPANGPDSYAAKHKEGPYASGNSQGTNTSSNSADSDIIYSGFYLGGGISSLRIGADNIDTSDVDARVSVYGLNLIGGYEFNKNIALEGRFAFNIQDWGDEENDTTAFSLFAKPIYPVNDIFSIYGLIGFGNIKIDGDGFSDSDSGFQWGLGASATIQDNISAFVDYTQLWNDNKFDEDDLYDENLIVDVITVGLTYKF